MTSRFFDLDGDKKTPADGSLQTDREKPPTTAGESSEARLALLIGNSRYKGSPLRNPVRDARRLGFILEQLGFEVTLVENAGKLEMERAVVDFRARLDARGPESVAFLFFAGHGLQHGGRNYLLPVDARIDAARHLPLAALTLDWIIAELTGASRKAMALVLDTCRANVEKSLSADTEDPLPGLARLQLPPEGMLVVYSTASGARAEDGRHDHSPYAQALAEALPELLTPATRFHEVFVTAAEEVRRSTEGKQSPALFLQGSLPALALDETDAERLERGIRLLPPAIPWMRFSMLAAAIAIIVGAASIGWLWTTTYPEDRIAWLARWGLATPPDIDIVCAEPWERTDAFGLSRSEWCDIDPVALVARIDDIGSWPEVTRAASRSGNAKALLLQAARLLTQGGKEAGGREEIVSLLRRATKSELPAAGYLLSQTVADQTIVDENVALERIGDILTLDRAAQAGHLQAALLNGFLLLHSGDGQRLVAQLEPMANRDATGTAQWLLARAFDEIDETRDPVRADFWLLESAVRGNVDAVERAIRAEKDGEIGVAPAQIEARIADLRDSRPWLADYWEARRDLGGTGERSLRAFRTLQRLAGDGFGPAAREVGIALINTPLADGTIRSSDALRWLTEAADKDDLPALLELGDIYSNGILDRNGRQLIEADANRALAYYSRAEELGDPWGTYWIARLHERGDLGRRDPQGASDMLTRLVQPEQRDDRLREAASFELARINSDQAYFADAPAWQVDQGNAKADLKVLVYFPFGCPDCERNFADVIRPLVDLFDADGLVDLRLRISWDAVNGPSHRVANLLRCVAPPDRPAVLDWMSQDSSVFELPFDGLPDDFAATIPLTAASDEADVVQCLADPDHIDATNEQWWAHRKRTQVPNLRYAVVAGRIVADPSSESLREEILLALPPGLREKVPSFNRR